MGSDFDAFPHLTGLDAMTYDSLMRKPDVPYMSVIIPTMNAAARLDACLEVIEHERQVFPCEVIVADAGSTDDTYAVVARHKAKMIHTPIGRARQMKAGVSASEADWFLFLSVDCVLPRAWGEILLHHTRQVENANALSHFRIDLDEAQDWARLVEKMLHAQARFLGLPMLEHGMLISRSVYQKAGGFKPLPILEDVDLSRRLGWIRQQPINARIRVAGSRFRIGGSPPLRRAFKNLGCMLMFQAGVKPEKLVGWYR